MSPIVGWTLAVLAVAAGYAGYGWRGVVLALTVVVFWLLLQFSRALRVLRAAAGAPKGRVPSAVMLQSKLQAGLRLMEVIRLAGSLGEPAGAVPEAYVWRDDSGAMLRVEFLRGRCTAWQLDRTGPGAGRIDDLSASAT